MNSTNPGFVSPSGKSIPALLDARIDHAAIDRQTPQLVAGDDA
jgi:hypothetical protein